MSEGWLWALLALNLVVLLALALWLVLRRGPEPAGPLIERLERELRDELGRLGQASRGDLGVLQRQLLAQSGETARTQNEQIDAFRLQLAQTQQSMEGTLRTVADSQAQGLQRATESQAQALQRAAELQAQALQRAADQQAEQLQRLAEAHDRRMAEMRQAVEARLATLQEGNEKKLEQMRATVDEKLHATLEQRLGQSFHQVAERLDQVHKGLGEMQALARDVGALNRVLTNVKSRGVFGEVQLAALLEQVLTAEQFAANVATVPGSNERVEFAVRLPGRDAGLPTWLPLDAKFPREDYERLLDAHERADAAGAEAAGRAIELRLKAEARSIRSKYIAPPHTTDFGILFLPTEGLYAEALRRPGLSESLQRESKVMLAGPTTLLALLNSLQMGFRTLALEKRSAEVWEVLGAVKTEFGKFGDVLAKTRKKLHEAGNTIEAAEVRTRAMARQLRQVQELPAERAAELLPPLADAAGEDEPWPPDAAAGAPAVRGRPEEGDG